MDYQNDGCIYTMHMCYSDFSFIADRWLCFTISNHKTHTCHARMAYLTGCGVYDDLRIKEEL